MLGGERKGGGDAGMSGHILIIMCLPSQGFPSGFGSATWDVSLGLTSLGFSGLISEKRGSETFADL